MLKFLASRLLQLVLVLFVVMLVVFVTMQVIADPATLALPPGSNQAEIDAFNTRYGFDRPLLVQLGSFLWGAIRLDFGTSIWLEQDALGVVMDRLPLTLMLAFPAVTIALVIGIVVGAIVAQRPDSVLDKAVQALSHAANATAEFWFAIMLILVFSLWLHWLPAGGTTPLPTAIALPIMALALHPIARFIVVVRTSMLTEYSQQYVMTARAKGLSELRISAGHVMRNASIPIVTLYFFELGRIFLGSAIVIEAIFGWPGVGSTMIQGLQRGDVFLIGALVAVAATIIVVLNLIADLLYFVLDPRTKTTVGASA